MKRKGKCLCGAVSYTAETSAEFSACHCEMCRRWTGGPLMSTTAKDITWEGEDHIKVFTSSTWAERGFCSECGSTLFYRMTAKPHQGHTSIALGTLEDQTGLTLTREWFIDKKPDGYDLAGERKRVTEAEAFAMLSGG